MTYLKKLAKYLAENGFSKRMVIETFNRCDEYASPLEFENRAMFNAIVKFDEEHKYSDDDFLNFDVEDLYHTYHIVLSDNTYLPNDYKGEYDTFMDAYDAMLDLLGSFNSKLQIRGDIYDDTNTLIEY